MARDVEFALTASDRTGAALASVERGFKKTADRIKEQQDDIGGSRLIQAVARSSPQLAAKLTQAFSAAADAAPLILGAGMVAAAPLIGATISAAVIGGAGVGGVLGGVLLAARDPRVKAAGTALGQNLLGSLESDAAVFVDPILRNVGKIESRFEAMRGRIQGIFRNSAGFLDPLVNGALQAVDGILLGMERLTGRAKPVMDQLGASVGVLGEHLGSALDTISKGSDGAASGLKTVTDATAALIDMTAVGILALTKVWGWLDKIGAATGIGGPLLSAWAGGAKDAGTSADAAAPSIGAVAAAIGDTSTAAADSAPNLQRIAEATRAIYNANSSLMGSELGVEQAFADADKVIKQNGRTLDIHTQKGRDNERSLLAAADAAQKQYDNFVALNGVGPKSAAMAEVLRGRFIALAEKTGKSAGAAKDLANKILDIPDSHNTKITAQTAAALENAREVRRAIDSVHGKTVEVHVSVTGTERLNALGHRIGGYSAGDQSWAAVDASAGRSRTGGPTQVNVANDITVSLDGAPFRQMVAQAVDASERRQIRRAKVGKR